MSDDRNDWGAIAHRGEFDLTLLTLERCNLDGVPMHREAILVGMLVPDGLPRFEVGFSSIDLLREYIAEMAPRAVTYMGSSPENARALRALVEGSASGAVH